MTISMQVSLPTELWMLILTFVSAPADLAALSRANRSLGDIATMQLYSHLWILSYEQRSKMEIALAKSTGLKRTDSKFMIDDLVESAQEERRLASKWELVKGLDMGLCSSIPGDSDLSKMYGGVWEHRFISPFLLLVGSRCKNLERLNLSGCQFYDSVFTESLDGLGTTIKHISVARSSIRSSGLASIAQSCPDLQSLDVSGIMKFRRNSAKVILEIVKMCKGLRLLVANDCPDFNADFVKECKYLNQNLNIISS